LNPAVDPAYQSPSTDAGRLNLFGWGFVPGEELTLLREGSPIPVVGDGPPYADEVGKFLANGPNTGGQMSWLEQNPDDQGPQIGVQGSECTAVVDFPSETCGLIAWWGDETPHPSVEPAYQNPSTDAGHLNLYGWGFIPGESIRLLESGTDIPVAGDGPPYADSLGRFLANGPNTGGQMYFLEELPQPVAVGAQGDYCTASAAITMQAPEGMNQAVDNSPLPWWWIALGGLLGAGAVAAVIAVRLKARRV
jgi:hypothetical protein